MAPLEFFSYHLMTWSGFELVSVEFAPMRGTLFRTTQLTELPWLRQFFGKVVFRLFPPPRPKFWADILIVLRLKLELVLLLGASPKAKYLIFFCLDYCTLWQETRGSFLQSWKEIAQLCLAWGSLNKHPANSNWQTHVWKALNQYWASISSETDRASKQTLILKVLGMSLL